ncbi:MAG: hypothetical protein ACYCOR_03400 [Acidobacteriaceae bacterium]
MNDRQSFSNNDENDTLLFDTLQDYVLEHYPNPQRIGCLDRQTLEEFVSGPENLDLADPKYLHVFKCAECTRDLMTLRQGRQQQITDIPQLPSALLPAIHSGSRRWMVWAGALAFGCVLLVIGLGWRSQLRRARKEEQAVSEVLDLSQSGGPRGTRAPLPGEYSLPRKLIDLHVTLPYYSPAGAYRVSVATDRNLAAVKAEGRAVATSNGAGTRLSVRLDLRPLPPGRYYLATTHEGDSAAYFYSLKLK